jgi:hypothetical protein
MTNSERSERLKEKLPLMNNNLDTWLDVQVQAWAEGKEPDSSQVCTRVCGKPWQKVKCPGCKLR